MQQKEEERTNTEILASTLQVLRETDDLSTQVGNKLDQQTDQIHRMHKSLGETEESLQTSNQILHRMTSWIPWRRSLIPTRKKKDAKKGEVDSVEKKKQISPGINKDTVESLLEQKKSDHVSLERQMENQQLDALLEVLQQIHKKGVDIHTTLGYQEKVLDDLGDRIEETKSQMKDQTQRMKKIC